MRRTFYLFIPALLAIVCARANAQLMPSVISSAAPAAAGVTQDGLFLTMPVTVDGIPVLKIATLASPAPGAVPIDTRALLVQNAIAQVLAVNRDRGNTDFDPRTFKVSAVKEGSQYALFADDGKHAAPVAVVTVTSDDAKYAGVTQPQLASQWQGILQASLMTALDKRQPDTIRKNVYALARVVLAVFILSAIAALAVYLLRRRIDRLQKMVEERRAKAEDALDADDASEEQKPDAARRRILSFALRTLGPEQRLKAYKTMRDTIIWFLVLVWFSCITYGLLLFPMTTTFGAFLLRGAARVVFIWIGAIVIDRLLQLAVNRVAELGSRRGATSEDRARHILRVPTITQAIGGFKSFLIIFIAVLATLSALNISVASVVTIGGIAAVAVGFASQSLVRDVLGGLLVLLEDQYVVGDEILVGTYGGVVETLTLRIVQLRDAQGRLITISHGNVTQVVNTSRNWSRVDYRVAVMPGTDIEQALRVMRDVFESMSHDPQWSAAILKPVELIGVQTVWQQGIVLRAWMRTAALQHDKVQRELNMRMYDAFTSAGIRYGVDPSGTSTLTLASGSDPS